MATRLRWPTSMRLRASRPSASPSQARVGRDAQSPRGDMLHPTHLALVTLHTWTTTSRRLRPTALRPLRNKPSSGAPRPPPRVRASCRARHSSHARARRRRSETGAGITHGLRRHGLQLVRGGTIDGQLTGGGGFAFFHEGGIDALLTGAYSAVTMRLISL